MGHKVGQVSRGRAVAISSDGEDPDRPSPGPSRKREGRRAANPLMHRMRIREDGWTVARTRAFLGGLARTGCVADAAGGAGGGTTSYNRSRKLFPESGRAHVRTTV